MVRGDIRHISGGLYGARLYFDEDAYAKRTDCYLFMIQGQCLRIYPPSGESGYGSVEAAKMGIADVCRVLGITLDKIIGPDGEKLEVT